MQSNEAIVLVLEQELEDFLKVAAKYNGILLTFSGPVKGTLKNASLPISLEKLLPRLERRFDLAWYMNDRELYVSRASNNVTRDLSLEGIELHALKERLSVSGISSSKYSIIFDQDPRKARLVGSPSHLDAISKIAATLRK